MTHPDIETIRALIPANRKKLSGCEWLSWNDMSKLGLIVRINTEILHPLGLALSRDPMTGYSEAVLIAPDGKWEYSQDIKPRNNQQGEK